MDKLKKINPSDLAIELGMLTGEVITGEDQEHYYVYLIFPEGKLGLHEGKRLEVHALQPDGCTQVIPAPQKITLDPSRPLEAIARDITRRILPEARAYWTAAREAQAEYMREIERTREFAASWKARGLRTTGYQSDSSSPTFYGSRIEIRTCSKQTIHKIIITDPTEAETLKILQLLGETTP